MPGKHKTFLGKLNGLFPTCKEVTLLVVKEQEQALTRSEKLKLFFHAGIVCSFCKVFRRQSGLLHQHIHKAAGYAEAEQPRYALSDQKKSELQAEINKRR